MSVTVILDNVKVQGGWTVDITRNQVRMPFVLRDANNVQWYQNDAIFWRELPLDDEGQPWPEYPKNYFVLDSTTFDNLLAAHQAMKAAIEAEYLTEEP